MEAVHGIKGYRQRILANKSPWTKSAPRPSSCTTIIFPNALTVISQQGCITRPCIRHSFLTQAQKVAMQLQLHSTKLQSSIRGRIPQQVWGRGFLLRFLAKEQIKDQECVVWALFVFNVKAFSSIFAFDCANFLQTLRRSAQTGHKRKGTMPYVSPQVCVYVHIQLRYGVFKQ